MSSSLALDRYLDRTGFEGPLEPTMKCLEELQAWHQASIPFENIDPRLGLPVSLDLERLQRKLVARRRGGYCFEQNSLFCEVLRTVGFSVTALEARVRPPGATAPLPRTHMVLTVEIDGRRWLADVGFGGDGALGPVPLDGGVRAEEGAEFRIGREAEGLYVLRRLWRGSWSDLYAFTSQPPMPIDFVVANHFTSTHPSSIFVKMLTVQRVQAGRRLILRDRTLTERVGEEERQSEISDADLLGLLRQRFGIELAAEEGRRLVELGGPEERAPEPA